MGTLLVGFTLAAVQATLPIAPAGADALAIDGRSGREIYSRVLENRFESFRQMSRLSSGDRGGREQESRMSMSWQSFRDEEGQPNDGGVLSKTLVKYSHPFELRYSGYLVLSYRDRANDQFVYYPSRRRVVRVSLRSEAVFGTDFSFEDVIPRELEDAEYRRLPDDSIAGTPVFVVAAVPRDHSESEYSQFHVYVEKRTFVPLRTRYWDAAGVEVKELRVQPDSIQEFGGVYVPMRLTMRHLLHDTYTNLVVSELNPNPEFTTSTFAVRSLESH